MFGNNYNGDDLAKEFYKLVTLKKKAFDSNVERESLVADLENHVPEEAEDPSQFLKFLNKLEAVPEITEQIDGDLAAQDEWSSKSDLTPNNDFRESMYQADNDYLLNPRASVVLNGLGKIAGSLKQRGEIFAADIVEATANSIKNDMVKEASERLNTITILSKIASDISETGDQFTSDMVAATIGKIKTAQWMSDSEEAEGGPEEDPSNLCEKCLDDEEENPEQATGEFKDTPLCAKHLEDAHYWDAEFAAEDKHTRFQEGGWADYGDGSSSFPDREYNDYTGKLE